MVLINKHRNKDCEKIQPCKSLCDLAAVMAGQVRLEIVALLAQGSRDVSSITEILCLDLSHVSTNLRVLRKRGLIEFKRDQRRRIYGLSKSISSRTQSGILHLYVVCSNGDRLALQIKLSDEHAPVKDKPLQETCLKDDPNVAVIEVVKIPLNKITLKDKHSK